MTDLERERLDGFYADCVRTVGSASFTESFLQLARHGVGAEQCMIFGYDRASTTCLLSRNFGAFLQGKELAERYVEAGFAGDPLYPGILALSDGRPQIVRLGEIRSFMPSHYRKVYFERPRLGDKISILSARRGRRFIASFYRAEGRGVFQQPDSVWNLVSALLETHFRPTPDIEEWRDPSGRLSLRERQVCAGILRGLKVEAIGAGLGLSGHTVSTYKKRAYEKLGINSRTALFSLASARQVRVIPACHEPDIGSS